MSSAGSGPRNFGPCRLLVGSLKIWSYSEEYTVESDSKTESQGGGGWEGQVFDVAGTSSVRIVFFGIDVGKNWEPIWGPFTKFNKKKSHQNIPFHKKDPLQNSFP